MTGQDAVFHIDHVFGPRASHRTNGERTPDGCAMLRPEIGTQFATARSPSPSSSTSPIVFQRADFTGPPEHNEYMNVLE